MLIYIFLFSDEEKTSKLKSVWERAKLKHQQLNSKAANKTKTNIQCGTRFIHVGIVVLTAHLKTEINW